MKGIILPSKKDINITKSKINEKFNNQQEQIDCALCGKAIKSEGKGFHKSHTIPFFCLENIKALYEKNYGVLKGDFVGIRTPFSDSEFIGTNKAGVFYSICSECDQEKFNIYESEDALLNRPPKELVDALALKIYLNELFNSKFRNFKNSLNHSELTEDQMISSYFKNMGKMERPTVELDLRDFQDNLDFAKKSFENGYSNYNILYSTILDYTVPIAAQVSIPISRNVDFSKLQDLSIFNHKKIEDLLVCIFPLKNKTVIIIFYKIGDRLMKTYSKQFRKLTEEEKLREIFYLLIRYKATNYFFSPLIKDILLDDCVREICSIEDTSFKMGNVIMSIADFENQKLKSQIPSILTEQYSMQNLLAKGNL